MTKITGFETYDVRFPTSRTLAGSDAMNPAPDYSAAYVVIRTDAPGLAGHGYAFTIGRGNDVQLAAIRLLEPFLAGQDLDEVLADLGGLGRRLVSDSPLHWLGPACGVVHMATGAVLNACWDLAARRAGQPLWLLLAEMSPEEIAALVDFRYLSDALTPDEALALLERGAAGRDGRVAALRRDGYPAYSTGPGWLGYSDERMAALCQQAVAEGFGLVKIKVGAALADDKPGGVGLCEIVQHLSMFDYVALSGTTQGRMIEWIDHLHEHFAAPAVVTDGRYRAPRTPGASTEILPESLAEYTYPSGPAWRGRMP